MGKLIYHKKGDHKSCPLITKVWLSAPTFQQEYSFTESCKYDLGTVDNYDWNKLTGVSFDLLDATKNSVMCGWRYNKETDNFELCMYNHINGSFNPPADALCTVKASEKFTVKITFNKLQKTAWLTINNIYTSQTSFLKFGICRQINSWFGGNMTSPNYMEIINY